MQNTIATRLAVAFKEAFDSLIDPIIVLSPGRVNIIGEHTDYNDGFVLPAAIDKAAYIAIALRDDDEIHLLALDLNETFLISIKDLKPVGDISWPNYIIGVVAQFAKKSIPLKGFNAILTSDVPIGAGLSSSAAVECATVFALNELLQTNLSKIEMIQMAQKAEHEYAGVMCGIMDQFASVMGRKDHVIKLDCHSLEYEYVPFKLDGIKILLLNTNVKHSLASSEYNTRREECEQAVAWINEHRPEVKSLRDASEDMLDKYVVPKNRLIDQRSRFIVQEINRLQEGCKDLTNGDINALGKKMFATHDGLSNMYGVSCKELDYLVDFVRNNDAVIGARMMGGGFGGCTINLVKEDTIEQLVKQIQPAYEETMGLHLDYYIASIEDGTKIIQ
jgi:galactokinase